MNRLFVLLGCVLWLGGWAPHGAVAAEASGVLYREAEASESMRRWLVLGPVPIGKGTSASEETQKEAFAQDWLTAESANAEAGRTVNVQGTEYTWRAINASQSEIDLAEGKEPAEFSIAYAWAEIEVPTARKAVLGVGSDDGVKVWLNGKLVHARWVGRPTREDDDPVPVEFVAGRNRLLLKIQNMEGPWGFACRVMGPEAQSKKLFAAARNNDLELARTLVAAGAKVDALAPSGLTAIQAARLRGHKEMVDWLAGQGADAKAPLPPPEKLVESLMASIVTSNSPGAAVLIAKDGKILFEKGFGLASVEHHVPITPETKFRIGSISKQFTAAAILKLSEEGKLGLQDKLLKFVADYPRGDEVTIHHLLTHTSGIKSYTGKPDFIKAVTVGAKPDEHIETFKKDPYDFSPGEKWSYNNSGYFLLGYIVEKVSGKSFGDYLHQAFFEPLGMKDSGVHEATAILENEATGYMFEGDRLKKALNWDMSKAGGAGALYSTVGDLQRWNEALFAGRVLRKETLAAAFTPVRIKDESASEPKETGYGYGWSIQKFRGVDEIGHGGGLHGFVSQLSRIPKENLTVTVLANSLPSLPGLDPGELTHQIVEFYLGEKLAQRELPNAASGISVEKLEAIVGRYDYGNAVLTVTRREERIFAQLSGQPEFEIYPKNETTFFWKVVEAEVTFVKNADGRVTKAVHRQGGGTVDAPRIEEPPVAEVSTESLEAVVGRYDYGAGGAVMTVTREGKRVFAQLTGQPRLEIFPKSESEFFWKAVHARVTFVKNGDGKVTKAVHEQAGQKFDAPRMD